MDQSGTLKPPLAPTRPHATIGTAARSRRGVLSFTLAAGALFALTGASARAQSQVRAPWQPQIAPYETATITVGEQAILVELATTPQLRGRGLGYRQGLAPGTGMLFVFPQAGPRSFWMKGMRFCLDIIYINDGEIVSAAESVCPDPYGTPDGERQSYPSNADARFVLELPAGWLADHGYGVGTPVEIPGSIRTDN